MTTPSLWTREDSASLAAEVEGMVRAHVAQGRGADGETLKPLANGKASTLNRTGRLLASLKVKATETSLSVTATAPYAEYVSKDRPFVGLSDEEQARLDKAFLDRLDAREKAYDRTVKVRSR